MDNDRHSNDRADARLPDACGFRTDGVRVVVNPGRASGVQHPSPNVVARQRNVLTRDGHLCDARFVPNGNHEPCAVGLKAQHPSIDDV